jgi:curved DNA-binding protein CbpA
MPAAGKSDPYAVLGIDRFASPAAIRAAYRALVARYHPDRHQGNPLEDLASERMAEINQAYELLSDPPRRAAFDEGRPDPGAPGANAAGDARGDTGRAAGPPRRPGMHPMLKWGLLVLGLPLLIRGGAGLVRALAGLGGDLFGALGELRGTPVGLVAVLLGVVLLVVALWRRRRRRRRP